jgi:hypothetical protein
MNKMVIDITTSRAGFAAEPGDSKGDSLRKNDGARIFDWYFSATIVNPLFRPSRFTNLDQVKLIYEQSGAFIFGRRTYDITNGCGGAHPANAVPVFVSTPTSATGPNGMGL